MLDNAVVLILALWKAMDICVWLYHHMSVSFK
jgi:hypothetical protein